MSLAWSDGQRLPSAGVVMAISKRGTSRGKNGPVFLSGHRDIVLDVLHVPYLDTIVSGSLDRTALCGDPFTEQMTANLQGGHTKGVNALTYNGEHWFLCPTGFDHDAFVWSPFAVCLLYRLQGHKAALMNCHAAEGTHELITADTHWCTKTVGPANLRLRPDLPDGAYQ